MISCDIVVLLKQTGWQTAGPFQRRSCALLDTVSDRARSACYQPTGHLLFARETQPLPFHKLLESLPDPTRQSASHHRKTHSAAARRPKTSAANHESPTSNSTREIDAPD